MTLHKAKGHEFNVVFRLDLYKYIMPQEDFSTNTYKYLDGTINLHYVGITRAKSYCFLATSNKRTKSDESEARAQDTMLFGYNMLNKYTYDVKNIYVDWSNT